MATYKTLGELVKAESQAVMDGQRAYRVKANGETLYAVSNSPGQAALTVCEVETVKQRELQEALLKAVCENAKQKASDA